MTNPYGPWATAIDAGRNPQLSAFWQQRLTMLVPVSRTSPVLSRHNLLGLVAAAVLVSALPTFHAAPVVAEQERVSQEKGKDQGTNAARHSDSAPVHEPKLLYTLLGHAGIVYSVAYSPDGKTLASGGDDGTIKLWDTTRGRFIATFTIPRAGGNPHEQILVRSVTISPDGKTVASGYVGNSSFGMISLWDVASGKNTATFNGHAEPWSAGITGFYSIAFAPDGKTLASGNEDPLIRLWDVANGKITATLKGHTASVYSVAFSPDGKTLASGSQDGTARLWDVLTGGNKGKFELATEDNIVQSVTFSPGGKTLAAACWANGAKLLDMATVNKRQTLDAGFGNFVFSVALSPDSKILASGYDGGTIRLWNVNSGKTIGTLIGHHGLIRSMMFSPDGKILATGSDDKTIKLWDLGTESKK